MKFLKKPLLFCPKMNSLMSNIKKRGDLIVFEGCDKCGKTTQSKNIVEFLVAKNIKAKYINFPARDSLSGKLINDYLTNKQDLPDESIHLLFTANRWEAKKEMQELLENGINLIVDRYSYSGVAFSAAKGLNYEWCKSSEAGLLKPDLVIYLNAPLSELSDRSEYGTERYEKVEFQKKVEIIFDRMYKEEREYWIKVDANKNVNDLQAYLCAKILEEVNKTNRKPLALLWS